MVDAWPPGATVAVNINTTGLDAAQVNSIQQAFSNWNGVNGVTLNVSLSQTNTSGPNTYNVVYGPLQDGANAFSDQQLDANSQYVASNNTVLNNTATCLSCITKIIAHDVGHTFGLNDNFIPNSALQNWCSAGPNYFPSDCQSEGPTLADMQTANCEDDTKENDCNGPGNASLPQCKCGQGTSGDCSGGLVCGANEQDGVCGCTDACDDPTCPGWTSSCGTCRDDGDCNAEGVICTDGSCVSGCRDDGDCGDGTICSNNACVAGCRSDDDCPGAQVCTANSCQCDSSCDDPSCPGYSYYVCADPCADGSCDDNGGDDNGGNACQGSLDCDTGNGSCEGDCDEN